MVGKVYYSIAEPGSGAILTPGFGMEKNPDPGSEINFPDHISKSFVPVFPTRRNILCSGVQDGEV